MQSFVSRAVVTGVFLTSAAGWVGVQTTPSTAAPAESSAVVVGQPGVRDRAAWQPSPVPSQSQTQPAAPAVQAVQAAQAVQQAPTVRDRSAWQPSPIPSQGQAQVKAAEQAPIQVQMPAPVAQVGPAVPAAPSFFSGFMDWLKGIFTKPAAKPSAMELLEPIKGADQVIPMTELFNKDVLDSLYPALPEQRGEWKIESFYSRALGREMSYMAYLPAGYSATGRTYPSLYLLHGVGSPEAYGPEEWLGYALTENLDRMVAAGLIEPMVVILPQGEQSYWINHADGGPRWADYVAQDVVKHVDSTFRTDARREKRAIGGLSMGGHGAVQLAYNNPDVFSVAGAHSPTIRPFETSPEFFGDQKWFAKHDPISLARTGSAAQRILTWVDVGELDEWRTGAQALGSVLASRGAAVEYRVLEGEHEGWYWEYYLPEYLHFYSSALHASGQTTHGAPQVVSQLLTSSGVSAATVSTHS